MPLQDQHFPLLNMAKERYLATTTLARLNHHQPPNDARDCICYPKISVRHVPILLSLDTQT